MAQREKMYLTQYKEQLQLFGKSNRRGVPNDILRQIDFNLQILKSFIIKAIMIMK
jgi:hypothetical protein